MKTVASLGLSLVLSATLTASMPTPAALQARGGGGELAMGIMMGNPMMIVKGSTDLKSGKGAKKQQAKAANSTPPGA